MLRTASGRRPSRDREEPQLLGFLAVSGAGRLPERVGGGVRASSGGMFGRSAIWFVPAIGGQHVREHGPIGPRQIPAEDGRAPVQARFVVFS